MSSIQNLGISLAFGAAFVCALLLFSEFNTASANTTAVVLYKARKKLSHVQSDEEMQSEKGTAPISLASSDDSTEEALAESSFMADIFSWQHINYTVPISGGQDRKLLEDISGYVIPGKLTALMGASGAGKVEYVTDCLVSADGGKYKTTLLNVLAQRVDVGIVSGDRLVNGQALPRDFQSQTCVETARDSLTPDC